MAVCEWECCLQQPEAAAPDGARFIADQIIEALDRVFHDFARTGADMATDRALPGLG